MRNLIAMSLLASTLAGATALPAQAQTEKGTTKVKAKKDKIKAKGNDTARPEGRGQGGPGGQRPDEFKDLNLTADQQTRVQAIRQEQMAQMKQMREQGQNGDREAQMKQMRALEEGTDARLKGVLTPEQYKIYQTKKQERRPGGRPPGEGRRVGSAQ